MLLYTWGISKEDSHVRYLLGWEDMLAMGYHLPIGDPDLRNESRKKKQHACIFFTFYSEQEQPLLLLISEVTCESSLFEHHGLRTANSLETRQTFNA